MREEKLVAAMASAVQQLVIAPETLAWLQAAVTDSDKTEAGARDQALRQLKAERDRHQARIDTMYLDRLDGRISAEFFDEKSTVWREEKPTTLRLTALYQEHGSLLLGHRASPLGRRPFDHPDEELRPPW